ncbi:beta strand repeat-containing protein [Flavobacterium sp.]|uniref:beta strand repeat-containing protein n=1 Tax=Flavobacterium sp. TaxID=239 RepID=UPI003753C055
MKKTLQFSKLKNYQFNISKIRFSILFIFFISCLQAATKTSTATGGTWSTGSTWVGGIAPTAADNVIIVNAATVTLTAATTITNVTINSGGTLKIGTINALTLTGSFINNGIFNGTSGRLVLNGLTSNFTNSGSFTMGSGRIYLSGNLTNFGTHTLTATQVRFYGNAAQSIAGFNTTGIVSMRKTGGIATLTGNMNNGGLTINGSNGTLNLGSALNHTSTGRITLTTGTLNGGSSTLNVNFVNTTAWSGTGSVFVAGTSTVKFGAAGNQTISSSATTFYNLTFLNSGIKTLTTGNCTATGIVSMEGTATVSAPPTYGANATLKYNTTTARTSGVEWITPFAGLGGVNIANIGAITMNNAKVFNNSAPLTINSGATLNTANFQLSFGGNFINSGGTFNAGSSPLLITNTMAVQSIAGFSTTGLVSMTKTTGTATLTGNIVSNGITINGVGGTLNLGSSFNHTSTGNITLTTGNLNGNSSTLNITAISATAWNGVGTLFTAGTSTVNFGAAGNQTISSTATTFNNLTFSNSGLKTLTTLNCTANGIVSIEGTATVSATPTYGANATLVYNTATARTAGVEWITPFSGLGGVIVSNTGAITMNIAKVFNISSPLTINTGATLNTANLQLTFGGNFINNGGTFNAGSSPIVITNTMATQSIAGFNTIGLVSMTKTGGTATFTGNTSGSGLTINGTGGTLNLGTGLTHTYSSNYTRTAGTLNGGSSILKFAGSISGTGGAFISGTGTVEYNGAAQTVVALPYYNLTLSGSGTNTFSASTTISNTLSVATGVVANLTTGLIHTSVGLSLGGVFQTSGSWGGTGSSAANINSTYFTASTGKINNNCSLPTITVQPVTPSSTCSGNGIQTISVTATGSGLKYFWRRNGVDIINSGIFSGQNTATLTLTNATTTEAGSYDVVIIGTCASSVVSNIVTVTVNPSPTITSQPLPITICQNTTGTFTVATSALSPTYQWQYSTNPITTWTNTNGLIGVSGNTLSTLTFANTPLTYNNYYIRCVITSSGCFSNSTPVLLLVTPALSVGSISSNQAICSGSSPSNDITISSATGTVQWQKADNSGFSVNLSNIGTNSTILTIAEIGSISSTTYFRAVVSNGVCTPVISGTSIVTVLTTTWSTVGGGSWDNGVPTSTTTAIISANYTSTGDLNACSLTVNNNAIVIVSSGDNVVLNGALTIASGSFTLNNNSNLIQTSDVANSGNIIVKRNSAPIKRLDYSLWSSPVSSQELQAFSPLTLSNRFYTYNSATNLYSVIASPSTTNFSVGTGYLIRVPNNHPTWAAIWNGQFTGVPNNGPVTVPVVNNTYNAVGNPYPSTIEADAFIDDNNIVEALYFWRKTNNTAMSSYATYTLAGGTGTDQNAGDPLALTPNGFIQVGQGFIVKSTSTSINFTNSMRVTDNSNQFLRAIEDRNRVWLDLSNTTGFISQTMVSYMDEATNDVDDGIDGKYFNDSQTALTTLINNNEYAIQGRPLPFDTADVVVLGFKVETAGSYTISINHFDGLFEETEQAIYLRDNLTNTVFDLKTGNYTFNSEIGVFNTRFEIIYTSSLAVEVPTIIENSIVVYKQNQDLNINSGSTIMSSIKVYDINGRLLLTKNNINASETKVNLKNTNQVLIIKITTDTNLVVTKKVIN